MYCLEIKKPRDIHSWLSRYINSTYIYFVYMEYFEHNLHCFYVEFHHLYYFFLYKKYIHNNIQFVYDDLQTKMYTQ